MSKKIHFFIFFRLIGDEVCLACSFFKKIVVTKRKKEQAKGELDKIEKILGAKIMCACPRCVYKGIKMHENTAKCMFFAI